MLPISPARPARRAAARRKQIVESDNEDEENIVQPSQVDDDEEDFTPVAHASPRRQSHRNTQATQMTPRSVGRAKRAAAQPIEPSEIFSATSSIAPEPASPTKRTSTTARKSIRASRKSRISIAPDLPPPFPTPQPSASPEPQAELCTPLADITDFVANENTQQVVQMDNDFKIEKKFQIFEKPMDIVVRTRALAAPIPSEPSEPKSRIVITYLILTNFKSYAGRQEVGPFHSSFSSVVGPNGSGKSNVIDSLLFVFGFRASKMRQGKISALIHNSAAFPDLGHCEVEVRFQEVIDQPGGKHDVVPNSSLIISRRAFKNNSSKYYIDGSESNFTAITTLLRDRGVDLDHKRFLILQGEVESIAQMKPKAANEHDDGLLEYLEDIIGTSKYKTSIEDAAAEVETLNEISTEKSARVQHVEKEKKSLEQKKDVAIAYIRDENELAIKQSQLYQIFLTECEDNIQVTGEAVNEMQRQLDAEIKRHQGNEDGIKQMQKQYAAQVKEYERFEQQTQAILRQMAKMDKENVKFDEKRKHLSAKMKKSEKSKISTKSVVSESAAYIERLAEDLERNAKAIEALEREMQSEETELATVREGLRGKTQALSDQITAKQKSLGPWVQQISEKQSAIAVAQSELAILQEGDDAGAHAVADVQAKIARLEQDKLENQKEIESTRVEATALVKSSETIRASLDSLTQKEPIIRSKVSSARQKADEARASFSKSKSQGDVLTGLMRLKESGRINGFHGRLGNLGAIDQKYDIAISTACPALDNLVVDSVEVGQQCIEYLRKNNLGRANLICLDRLNHRNLSPIDTPENVPRLFDLVKPKDKKFLPAFYSVLQNTLVADDLEQANRIAFVAQRWRVVSLDGQLIDKSGTMSGGGTRVAKGSMSSKIASDTTKEQVSKLEVDQESHERLLQEYLRELQDLNKQLKDVNEKIPALETTVQKGMLGIESIDRNLVDARRRKEELSAAKQPVGSNKGRIAALQKMITGLERDVVKLQQETAGIEKVVKALQDKIMEIGGVRLRGQKAKVDGLREQIDTLNEEISNAEVTRAREEKQKAKHEKARTDAEIELDRLAVDFQKVEDDVQNQNKDISGSRREAEEAQEALEAKKEDLLALKAEVDAKTAELNETRGVEIEMRNKHEENQKILAENQKRLKYWQDKMSKLSIQSITDLGEELPEQSLANYTRDELADLDKNVLKGDIAILEEKTQNVNVEVDVLTEYRRRVEEHEARSSDLAEAVRARDTAKKRCEELQQLRLEGFMEGFSTISLRLKEMYQMITMGGNAELELVDSLDPFSEGILFSVMPPKKSWKNISNLSGGEKTLSSLALVFALHHYKPTPLYVMDEIDAALDFRNVSIVASYIKERTRNAQFVVISLRNNMFEMASRLIGVYKVNHMTKSVTVENKDYINRAVAS